MIKKADFWRWFYRRWDEAVVEPTNGYTVLLPVPGDLPVFLKIALEVCTTQDPEHLYEILVIPDKSIQGFSELLEKWIRNYSISPTRLINLKFPEQLITRYQNDPNSNHFLQIIRGTNQVKTTHALLHDADLFITEPSFMKTHYEVCTKSNLACLGVSPVWDSWYEEQGIDHLVATWELMFETAWVRSFQPWKHRGHNDIIIGKQHTFDTTLWPQCQTSPERISRHQKEWGFIHFNYVISTYRWFQRSKSSFEDIHFRLLLIRLLINAYDRSGWSYKVPLLDELKKGITDKSNRVTYLSEQTQQNYSEFRSKLGKLIESGLIDDEKSSILSDGVQPFDRAFG